MRFFTKLLHLETGGALASHKTAILDVRGQLAAETFNEQSDETVTTTVAADPKISQDELSEWTRYRQSSARQARQLDRRVREARRARRVLLGVAAGQCL